MDPQFFDRINALQNFQNQQANRANLQQLQANQAELAALRQQLAEEANKPQCPHCGGPSEKGFDRCKNCGQEVIWYGHFVGKLGDRPKLEMAMKEYKLGIKREQELETQRQRTQIREFEKQHQAELERQHESRYWRWGCTFIILPLGIWFFFWLIKFLATHNNP